MPRFFLVVVCLFLSPSCLAENSDFEVKKLDRNNDGVVDLYECRFPMITDSDWTMRDDDFDGVFEKKDVFGEGYYEEDVSIKVEGFDECGEYDL